MFKYPQFSAIDSYQNYQPKIKINSFIDIRRKGWHGTGRGFYFQLRCSGSRKTSSYLQSITQTEKNAHYLF